MNKLNDLYLSIKNDSKKIESDFQFNDEFAGIFRDLYDAHTKWRLPLGYG